VAAHLTGELGLKVGGRDVIGPKFRADHDRMGTLVVAAVVD